MAPARRWVLIGAIPLLAWLAPSIAAAQGAGRVMDIDPSPISRGMGGASAAVFWTAEPNDWANPALLGYARGLRWQWQQTQLVPGLADDIYLTGTRPTLEVFGIGLENAGRPLSGAGRTYLDLGSFDGFSSFEEMKSWSVGVSLARLVGSIAEVTGHEPPAILDHVDLAFGMTGKHARSGDSFFGEVPSGELTDHGLLLRCGLGSERATRWGRLPLRTDLAVGGSLVNDNPRTSHLTIFDPLPPPETRRLGVAVRQAVGLPQSLRDRARSRLGAFLLDGCEPMVSLGLAYEVESVRWRDYAPWSYTVNHYGLELTAMNALSLRAGYVSDHDGHVEGATWGFGIAIPIGDVAGARFDFAESPQARDSGLPPLSPRSFSAFVDPLALARRLRGDAPRPD